MIFDSQVPIGGAEAVYLTARAEQIPDADVDRCADVFRSRLPEIRDFGPEQMRPPEPLRLYRATVTEHSILIRSDDPEHGRGIDSRTTLTPAD